MGARSGSTSKPVLELLGARRVHTAPVSASSAGAYAHAEDENESKLKDRTLRMVLFCSCFIFSPLRKRSCVLGEEVGQTIPRPLRPFTWPPPGLETRGAKSPLPPKMADFFALIFPLKLLPLWRLY